MDLTTVYSKTAKGVQAITQKGKRLPASLARALSLVDGRATVEEILEKAGELPTSTLPQILADLARDGYLKAVTRAPLTEFSITPDTSASMVVSETVDETFFKILAETEARKKLMKEAAANPEQSRQKAQEKAAAAAEEAMARRKIEARVAAETEERSRQEAVRRKIAGVMAQEEAAIKARRKADIQAHQEKVEKLEKEMAAAEELARREAQEKAAKEAASRAAAELKAREGAEERTRQEAVQRKIAEARAHEEADLKARREAENRALQEKAIKERAQEQIRREAREKATREADSRTAEERKAREAAEERAREEAKQQEIAADKAREEAAVKAREEAAIERRAQEKAAEKEREREKAEAREKAAAEEKARAEARKQLRLEARAREEAERNQAREDAEAKAKAEAEKKNRARLEAEEKIRAEEAARIKAEAEAREREEAERKAREEAEARAIAEAEECARREAEEKARAEEAARAKAEAREREETERRAREEAEARALAEAEERARREAEEKIRAQEEALAKTRAEAERKARQEAEQEQLERAEIEARARALADARAEEAEKAKQALAKPQKRKRPVKWGKPALILLAALILLPLVLLQVMSLNIFIPSIEKLASDRMREPVFIQSLRASLWPAPHLQLEGVSIGKLRDIKIPLVRVMPELTDFFGATKTIKTVEVESLAIDQDALARVIAWVGTGSDSEKIRIRRIAIKTATLGVKGIPLPPFEVDIALAATGKFERATLRSADKKIEVAITPKNDGFEVDIAANNWQPPPWPNLIFTELHAKAMATSGGMKFSEIGGRLYNGKAKGSATLAWSDLWSAAGYLDIENIFLAEAVPALTNDIALSGRLDAKTTYSMQARDLGTLFDNPRIKARFNVRDGSIGNIDLARAIQPRAVETRGGKTLFTNLSGNLALDGEHYQYRQLALAAGLLSASGEADIMPNKQLSGKTSVEMKLPSSTVRARLTLSGDLKQPVLRK